MAEQQDLGFFDDHSSDDSVSEITWDDVKHALSTLVDAPETDSAAAEWAQRALRILRDAGLTQYKTAAQRARVCARLAVVGRFYQRYSAHREGLTYDPSLEELLDPLELSLPPLLQAIPEDVALGANTESKYDLIRKAFQHLLREERNSVFDALVDGFGGRQRFFVWLWLSDRKEEEYRYDKEEYWDEDEKAYKEWIVREYSDGELESQVMMSTSLQKQPVYEWVMRQI